MCTSIIVAAELHYASAKKGSPRLAAQLDAALGVLEVLPFEAPADRLVLMVRFELVLNRVAN